MGLFVETLNRMATSQSLTADLRASSSRPIWGSKSEHPGIRAGLSGRFAAPARGHSAPVEAIAGVLAIFSGGGRV